MTNIEDIKLTNDQTQAMDSIQDWLASQGSSGASRTFTVRGLAGTGKTTLTQVLQERLRIAAMGPTGASVQVLKRKGIPAQTIHRGVYRHVPITKDDRQQMDLPLESEADSESSDDVEFHRIWDPSEAVRNADVIVVDEISMVDQELFQDILKIGKPVLALGDPFQLAPVGQGTPVLDMLKDDALLEQVTRQAADNPIVSFAHAIRQGEENPEEAIGDDPQGRITLLPMESAQCNEAETSCDQIIAGRNRTVNNLNEEARRRIHRIADGEALPEMPLPGDRLLCRSNRHELNIFNGQICRAEGELRQLGDAEDLGLLVMKSAQNVPARERVVDLSKSFGANRAFKWRGVGKNARRAYQRSLKLAYGNAITCHAAQGSQWKAVAVIDESECWRQKGSAPQEDLRWLYTAVTRSSERLVLRSPRYDVVDDWEFDDYHAEERYDSYDEDEA